ncbi:Gfo/Idh/MocA family protein [Planctomyces sp. SH-PL62]|uniref:Gfo/Idh/MocA family protein n=1 Tax=Planctomyces sp. SH-PL62 TaxID=1636152 RepID=UPI00078C697A|nr:Gfo/Idh/MocA family oxidoreductase [Planctomyces sp. SH-PL62]AMV36526.1 1,5-anhydro-D-fructose reductase [Planctomyces sp. SH-PL62]
MGAPYVLSNPPKVALIGGGFIGPVHAEALRRIGVEVAGLLDITPEKARPQAEKLGIPKVYNTIEEVLADPEIGAVHLASPNDIHFKHAKMALEAGKHVLCEKPLSVSSHESAELVKLAASRPNQAAGVNYNLRFYPLAQEMHARVARGDLGRIISVAGSYTQDWLLMVDDYNWRVEPDGHTNLRAIADIGTHWMDLAQFITGRHIESVNADLATFHPERNRPIGGAETYSGPNAAKKASEAVKITTEDYGAVMLHLSQGARGVFYVNQMHGGRKNRLYLEICGTEGSMVWDSESPELLWLGRRGAPNQLMNRDPSILSAEAGHFSHYPGGHAEGFPDAFKQLDLAFYTYIQGGCQGKPNFPTFAEGDREVRICEAIAQSAKARNWVQVEA